LKALRREGRRGVSPVIATLLLIVIAVAAAVLVYMWVIGYTAQMKPTTPEVSERLKIEAGNLTIVNNDVVAKLYVRNVGGTPVYINWSYLLTAAQDVVATADVSSIQVDYIAASSKALEAGATYKVIVTFSNAKSYTRAGQTYIVKIVTTLGNEFATELKLRTTGG
jgi:flagellin-like protein